LSTAPTDIKTLVIKIGTTLLSGPSGFDGRIMEEMVKELALLKQERGLNILVVSSGAIGCGMTVLKMQERPKALPLKQAVAAVGQSMLMHFYETCFRTYGDGLKIAQVLLSAADLDDRQSYLNVRNTIKTLFDLNNVIPIVNENDSTATAELRFGDNDTLAAKIAAKIDADLLIILSDVEGLYDRNPQLPGARLIPSVEEITPEIEALAGDTRVETSTGGMITKLRAARIACSAGLPTVIANGRKSGIVSEVLSGSARCTVFQPSADILPHRKRWIAFGRTIRGTLIVDDGASRALTTRGKSLLPAGITEVRGAFRVGDAVRVRDSNGSELARGLVNFSSDDLSLIIGHKSKDIEGILGHKDLDEVIHRDNLVML
jgi:glutamate 5-kinase